MNNIDYGKIFDGTATFYAKYRRRYPVAVFEDIASYFDLNDQTPASVLVDLGCGTGELTVPLAQYFLYVYGIDPSTDMLAESQKRASQVKIEHITWCQQKAEAFNFSQVTPFLTTAGVSFHWMDQEKVLKKVYDATVPGGGMVVIDDNSPARGKNKTEPWKMKRKEIINKYLGEDRYAGQYFHKDVITEKVPFEERFKKSPFRNYAFKKYPYTTKRTIDDIMGFLYSTSYAAQHLFGDRLKDFDTEMRAELLELTPNGIFEEDGMARMYFFEKV